MKPKTKVFLSGFALLLLAFTIACSCGSLTSLFTPTATPTFTATATYTPRPTATPTLVPMFGLEGSWRDPYEGTVHTIIWNGSEYVVVSSINDERGEYAVTYQYWDGVTMTWDYYVAQNDVTVTIQATEIDGNNMYLNWWSTNGNSGTDTFFREP